MLNTKLWMWIRIKKMDLNRGSFAEVTCNSLCFVILVLLILLCWLLLLSFFFLLLLFFVLLLFSILLVNFRFLFTLITIYHALILLKWRNLTCFVFFLFLLYFLSNLGGDSFSDLFSQSSFSSFIRLLFCLFFFDVILFFFGSKRFT